MYVLSLKLNIVELFLNTFPVEWQVFLLHWFFCTLNFTWICNFSVCMYAISTYPTHPLTPAIFIYPTTLYTQPNFYGAFEVTQKSCTFIMLRLISNPIYSFHTAVICLQFKINILNCLIAIHLSIRDTLLNLQASWNPWLTDCFCNTYPAIIQDINWLPYFSNIIINHFDSNIITNICGDSTRYSCSFRLMRYWEISNLIHWRARFVLSHLNPFLLNLPLPESPVLKVNIFGQYIFCYLFITVCCIGMI